MASKIIKGQVWISGNSLLQDQTLVAPGGITSNNTVALIKDIWEDLLSANSQVKRDRNFWYYEASMHNLEDEEITVRVEVPRPKDGLLDQYDGDPGKAKSDWARYWIEKFNAMAQRYQEAYTIQPKEIVLRGTEYVEPGTGEIKKVEEKRVENNELGDVTNLLLNLF